MRRAGRDEAAARAGRQWDAFVRGRPLPTLALDTETEFAATIARLHAGDDAPRVDPAFANRLGRRLAAGAAFEPASPAYAAGTLEERQMERVTTVRPGRISSPNGHHRVPYNAARRLRFRPRFSWSALFVVIAVLAVAVIPGRPFGFFDGGSDPGTRNVAAPTFPGQEEGAPTGTVPYRGDAARTGTMPGPGPSGAPMLAWKNQNQESVYSHTVPVVAGSRVFVTRGSMGGDPPYSLAALDLRTGNELWSADIGNPFRYVPAVADGLVYMPIDNEPPTDSELVALDEETGEIAWRYPLEGKMNGFSPAVADGLVYFTVTDFSLRALDAETGQEAWRTDIPGLTAEEMQYEGFVTESSVAVAGGIVYAVGSGGLVAAVDADDGHELWTFRTEGGQPGTPLVADGVLLVTSIVWEEGEAGTPGRLTALDAAAGTPRWGPIVLSSAATLAAGDGTVFVQVATDDGAAVEAFDIQTGAHRWTFAGGSFLNEPAYVDGDLYVSSRDDGTIQRVDAETGTSEWSVYLDAGDPVVVDSLVIASGHGAIYAVAGNGDEDALETASAPVDLSGLPACKPPRPVPTTIFEGTPSAAIAAETKLIEPEGGKGAFVDGRPARSTTWPQILAENVPTGAAARAEDVLGIQLTLRHMADCAVRPEGQRLIQGYFTDDFFRRGVAADRPDGYWMTWGLQPEEPEIENLNATVLDDGRIAAVTATTYDQQPHLLLIFVRQDGQWLIDELYKVTTEYFYGPMG